MTEPKCVAFECYKYDGKLVKRDLYYPCQFCVHIYDDSDPSVGLYGYGCDCEDKASGLPMGETGRCPAFRPRLPSDDLLDQLAYEQECAYWEEERRLEAEEDD